MPSPPTPLRLFPTEALAKKAGLQFADLRRERLPTVLYALLPAGEPKPVFLLSSAYRLTVAEQRWVQERQATVTKLGRFRVGMGYMPLQTNMLRTRQSTQRDAAE